MKYKIGQRVKYAYKFITFGPVLKGESRIENIYPGISYVSHTFYSLSDGSRVTEEEIIGLDLPPPIKSGKLLW